MRTLPTVRIKHDKHESGVLINETDLSDDDILFDPKAEASRRKEDYLDPTVSKDLEKPLDDLGADAGGTSGEADKGTDADTAAKDVVAKTDTKKDKADKAK